MSAEAEVIALALKMKMQKEAKKEEKRKNRIKEEKENFEKYGKKYTDRYYQENKNKYCCGGYLAKGGNIKNTMYSAFEKYLSGKISKENLVSTLKSLLGEDKWFRYFKGDTSVNDYKSVQNNLSSSSKNNVEYEKERMALSSEVRQLEIYDSKGKKFSSGGNIEAQRKWVAGMRTKYTEEQIFTRILKDSQFNAYSNRPSNELRHNRLNKVAIVGKKSVSITTYTPNGRYLDTVSFTDPIELIEHLEKNQIMKNGGNLKTGNEEKIKENFNYTIGGL